MVNIFQIVSDIPGITGTRIKLNKEEVERRVKTAKLLSENGKSDKGLSDSKNQKNIKGKKLSEGGYK